MSFTLNAIQVLIAILLAYVAWQNYIINSAAHRINKDKLRLDLFDRRYKVFDAFREFLLSFFQEARVDRTKFSTFIMKTSDAEFLFGKEITTYRQELIDNCVRLMQIELKFERQNVEDNKRAELATESEKLEKWVMNQQDHISKVFRKYLHFSINADPK